MLAVSCCSAVHVYGNGRSGGGFTPTKIRTFRLGADWGIGCIQSGFHILVRHGTSSAAKAVCICKSNAGDSAEEWTPSITSCGNEFGPPLTGGQPDRRNASAISFANMNASASPLWKSICTWSVAAIGPRIPAIFVLSCGDRRRGSDIRSSTVALSIASANDLFNRALSSVWMRLSHIPNATSPTIPIAIAALVMADSRKNSLYGGSSQSKINSATTATITSAPHQIPQRSHDAEASSNLLSAACFIVPRGRYHAGKNVLRALFVALVFWSLILGFLLLVVAQ